MEKTLTVGKTYTVTTASECTVTDSNGLVLCTATAGEQKAFVATTSTISFSDDSATVTAVFKGAPALGGSGGSGGGSGTPGTPAGFGTPTASATALEAGAEPTITVTASGANTAKVFDFAFGIPRGEKGEKGDTGATGPQGPQGATGTVDTSILEDYATISYVDEAIAAGGGTTITFDEVPTADSTNAVTSGGVYTAMQHSSGPSKSVAVGELARACQSGTAVGYNADAMSQGSAYDWSTVAIGVNAYTKASSTVSIGANSYAKAPLSVSLGGSAHSEARGGMAIGASAIATAAQSIAFGYNVKNADSGTAAIAVWTNNEGTQTLLYLMGAGSTLATTYEDGEACMGYVVKDTSGNVSACGTQKLSTLFPNNTAWATMALGLDDETPTPFLPTGATDPIEFPEIEDLTAE